MTLCCDLHTVTCELPVALCCNACPEATHPAHADGSPCVLTVPVMTARQMAEALIREFGQRIAYTDIWVRLPKDMPGTDRTRLADQVEELIVRATVTIALPEARPAAEALELDYGTVVALDAAPRGDEVHGLVVVGVMSRPDLTGQHIVIRDQGGRFYGAVYRDWTEVEQGQRLLFAPMVRRPRTVDTTEYEFAYRGRPVPSPGGDQ